MATVIMDPGFAERLRQERAAAGADRWDEVWEGTYMMAPLPDIEHQDIVGGLCEVLRVAVDRQQGMVLPGTNVSDREKGWEQNYRCPDVVVYFSGTAAKQFTAHWCGGPDFGIEIVSDYDDTRDKIPFYSKVATRELLIVDRNPWSLELFRLDRKKLKSVGISSGKRERIIESRVLPLTFQLKSGKHRPTIEVVRTNDGKTWNV
jgi:Uma2 family endonuclease